MTDPIPSLTDEDLSAVLDGEATPDVVARVRADPTAQARLEAFRAVATSVGQVPVDPLEPSTVDDLIAGALAQADDEAAGAPPEAPDHTDGVVTPLPPRRSNRGAPRWLVAASIAALAAIGLGLVWSGTRRDAGDTMASGSAADSVEESAGLDGDTGRADEGGAEPRGESTADVLPEEAAPSTTLSASAVAVEDLGPFADVDALRTRLASSFPPAEQLTASRTSIDDPSLVRCDQLSREVLEIEGTPTRQALATVDGEPVFVFEYERVSFADETTPTTVVTAVAPDTCDQLLTFER